MVAKVSNPTSTGGGGYRLEICVQSAFVALMLTNGCVPEYPDYGIKKIRLQAGHIPNGPKTDDIVISLENKYNNQKARLLGQIKRDICISPKNKEFKQTTLGAWEDFNSPVNFDQSNDRIILFTAFIAKSSLKAFNEIIGQVQKSESANDFFDRIYNTNLVSNEATKILGVLKDIITKNGQITISDEKLYEFVNCFRIILIDLDTDGGMVSSLLNSHLSQCSTKPIGPIMSCIRDFVMDYNRHAGVITLEKVPRHIVDDLSYSPTEQTATKSPSPLKSHKDIIHPRHQRLLSLMSLIKQWNTNKEGDREAVNNYLTPVRPSWLEDIRELMPFMDSPVYEKSNNWVVKEPGTVLSDNNYQIYASDLNYFSSLAGEVLGEIEPALELEKSQRFGAALYGKEEKYSDELKDGIADGCALLNASKNLFTQINAQDVQNTLISVINKLLSQKQWQYWASINNYLPSLAEAQPDTFLNNVESHLKDNADLFRDLYAQEGSGITGRNYITGLLWALENLAWSEDYLVRVTRILGKLAEMDPGGQWANRPINSIITIYLPWLPQTLAPIEKRKAGIKVLLDSSPEIAWQVLLALLPNNHQVSSGSHKPKWFMEVPDTDTKPSTKDYWDQVEYYVDLTVEQAGNCPKRLAALISHMASLTPSAFDTLLSHLQSHNVLNLPEPNRYDIWAALSQFTTRHWKYIESDWALPDDILVKIEAVQEMLAPESLILKFKPLFSGRDFDLFDEKGNYADQERRLQQRRVDALEAVLASHDVPIIPEFIESVESPYQLGFALADVSYPFDVVKLIEGRLSEDDNRQFSFAEGLIRRKFNNEGWNWIDELSSVDWTDEQKALFLCSLPFIPATWQRAEQWLDDDNVYWKKTHVRAAKPDTSYSYAVDRLLQTGRPRAAIDCLWSMHYAKTTIESQQCIQALLDNLSSNESRHSLDEYHITEMIKLLQDRSDIDKDKLFKIEWHYLRLLDGRSGVEPKHLQSLLSTSPEFYCEVIQTVYLPRGIKKDTATSEARQAIAEQAWRLLNDWKVVPGLVEDGSFDETVFNQWLSDVIDRCEESNHREVALTHIGKVLINAPADPSGLWIHKSIASALNRVDEEEMREGYRMEVYNSRGVHWVDPTGQPERDLAKTWRDRADIIENEGYSLFATALKGLAASYERDAERIIQRNSNKN